MLVAAVVVIVLTIVVEAMVVSVEAVVSVVGSSEQNALSQKKYTLLLILTGQEFHENIKVKI